MPYKLDQPATWLLPFLLAAILLCTSPALPAIFNATTRWGFLLIGLAWVFSRGQMGLIFRGRLGYATTLLLLWPLMTVVWSETPSLSLVKAAGFLIVACTMFALGVMWAWMRPIQQTMDAFLPFIIVFILLVAISGVPTQVGTGYGGIYEGAGNPNFTGIATAISLPLVFWQLFKSPASRRWFWWAVLGFLAFMLLATLSRSAMLVVGFTGLGCLIGMGAQRSTIWIFACLLIAIVPLMLSPKLSAGLEAYVYQSLIMKGALSNEKVKDLAYASRLVPLEEQLRAARAGGIFGGGYGAQLEVGHFIYINDIAIEIAPGTYTREKTNTPLAIMEEQGWVGLLITVGWLWVLFRSLLRQFKRAPHGNGRLQMGVLIAFLGGMMVNSLFEAWWVSPGSMEALVFWAVAGLTYGIGRRYEYASQTASGLLNE